LTSYYLFYTSKWGETVTTAATEVVTTEVVTTEVVVMEALTEAATGVAMELAPKLAASATDLDT
jgi:hypothetical protein